MALGDSQSERHRDRGGHRRSRVPIRFATVALDAESRRLFDTLQVGVVVQGPSAEVLYCNRRARELLGVDESQILGRTSLDANNVAFREDGTPLLGSEHPGSAGHRHAPSRTRRGDALAPPRRRRTSLAARQRRSRDRPRRPVDRVIVTLSDVTPLHAVTERLRDSEGRYRQLVENAQDIIYRTDMWGFFTYVNPVATRVTGWPPEKIVGKHFLELIREDHRQRVETHLKAQFRDRVGTSTTSSWP